MARIAYINLSNINNKYNMSQNQNASESASSLHKSQQLAHQIQQIKTKISNIPELEHQINSLQNLLKQEQSKTHQTSKKIDNKNAQLRNSAMNPKSYPNVQGGVSPQNSNKKIKIYQLKKKLENRQKQYKDKYVGYMGRLKKQEEIVGIIVDLDEEIKAQRGRGKELERYEGVIAADICKVNELVSQNAALLAEQKEVLNLYQMEKMKKIKEIKRLKKIINQSSENTEPDQELAESIMQDSDQEQQKRVSFKFELTENNTPELMSGIIKNQQQILIEDNEDIQPNLISFKRSPLQFSYSPPPPTIHNQQQNKQKKKIQSLSQIEPQFYSMQERLDRDTKKYGDILQALSLLRKGNRNLQAKIKHMGITVEMYRHKLQHLVRKNEEENRQMLDNVQKCQSVYEKLKERDGERGKIRGKLGIKVENTRMMGILNQQLGLDAQILMQKIPRLQSLSTQSQQIIRRLIGVQQNISQDIRNIL